ncbi:hypothetical protein QTJ16_006671 [Diplocarpon rosae]|uniref:Uncharacterized protein n=1 Tax=Diplocarpon rosae TaxID=946125 RepID=A0AAD9SW16_9HELO|nr:hypothetical protein QTJ16_006671 [Diplocarpon rosae]
MKLSLVAFIAAQAIAVSAITAKCGPPASLSTAYICMRLPSSAQYTRSVG